jgi:cholesterol transport system auxiliary component
MTRASLALMLLCLVGCASSRAPPRQFDLGDFDALGKRSSTLSMNLIVADVGQPSWMRTRDIFYRLDYESPPRPQRYSINQWVATPGELVTLRLRQAVQAANAGFTLPTSSVTGDFLLQTSLDEFTQAFSTTTQSQCILQLRASLWGIDGRMVAQHVFRITDPAPSADARGAALCLGAAVNRLSDEIVQWLSAAKVGTPKN